MKRFIVTIAAYFLILGALVSVINLAYVAHQPLDAYGVSKFEDMPENIQVCNLGSSHGTCSFDYSGIPEVSTFNFAFTAQSLSYDLRLLTHYQERLAEGCVVFIPVSYFTLFGESETGQIDFASKNERYYFILPSNLIREYDPLVYLCTVAFPAVGAGTDIFKAFLGHNTVQESMELRTADMIDVESDAQSAYMRHLVTGKRDEQGRLILLEEEVQALRDIIALCKEIGAVPIMVTTPYLAEYTNEIMEKDPDFLPYFNSIIRQISEETDIPYYDYAMDPRFRFDYALFMNSDHLNRNGAMKFTEILLNETGMKP